MERVLLVGGAGFIGSHIADKLIQDGFAVVAVDNLLLGREQNIQHLYTHDNFFFIEKDFSLLNEVEEVFQTYHFDVVFHFAANSDIQASASNPARDLHHTFITTANVLEGMRRFQVKKILFSSSSAIYGNKAGTSIKEDIGDLNPVSYYGGAKLASEAFISAYCHMNDIQSWIFRFPNVIGERLTHGVVFDFINKLKKNPEELTILGDGNQKKPYLYVGDLVAAIFQIWHSTDDLINCFHIGVETATTVTTIADIICAQMGLSQVKYRYTGGRVGWRGDVSEFCYDLSRIHHLGWKAVYTSDEAVRISVRRVLGI